MKTEYIILIVLPIVLLSGCSSMFVSQQLSENYVTSQDVKSDSPEAIDGNLNTISNNTRIHIYLPEKKSIRKIVIHSPNISNFILYESIGGEGQWRVIKSIRGNKQNPIEIPTQVTTNAIRIFITDTKAGRFADPGALKDVDGNVNIFSRKVDALPQIQEIELYGLIDSSEKADAKKTIF